MTDQERKQVLKMIAEGKITAEEGLRLLQALEQEPAEGEAEPVGAEAGPSSESGAETRPPTGAEFRSIAARGRRLWHIPLWIGVGFTLLGAGLMYWAMQASGFGFWFYCAWLPFLLGVLVMALAFASRSSRWLFVRVEQRRGERPGRIVFGFPLPLRLAAWFLRNFGHRIDDLRETNVDELLQMLDDSRVWQEPLIVNVDRGEDGERVQVFLG